METKNSTKQLMSANDIIDKYHRKTVRIDGKVWLIDIRYSDGTDGYDPILSVDLQSISNSEYIVNSRLHVPNWFSGATEVHKYACWISREIEKRLPTDLIVVESEQ